LLLSPSVETDGNRALPLSLCSDAISYCSGFVKGS
jgi:hypothetical protein